MSGIERSLYKIITVSTRFIELYLLMLTIICTGVTIIVTIVVIIKTTRCWKMWIVRDPSRLVIRAKKKNYINFI